MRELTQRLYIHRKPLTLGLFLAVLQAALAYPTAAIIRWAFDQAVPEGNTRGLVQAGFLLLGLKTGAALIASLTHRIDLKVCIAISSELRRAGLRKALDLPRLYHQQAEPGSVLETLSADMARIDTMLRALLSQVLPNGLLSMCLALVLLTLDGKLFLVMLVLWPATWLLNEYFRRRVVAATRECSIAQRKMAVHLRWMINSLDFIRVRNTDLLEQDRAEAHFRTVEATARPMSHLNIDYLQVQGVLLMALSLVVLLYGGTRVANNDLSSGSLLSFFLIVGLLNNSLREVAAGLYHVVVGQESLLTVSRFLSCTDPAPYSGTTQIALTGGLEMTAVSFRYAPQQPLLEGLNLAVKPARILALTGSNGSGKSTVISLLLGFYRPQQGAVRANGLPYSDLDLGHLRRQIGVVPQEPILFGGSIRDNLTYSVKEATPEQVWRSLACADAEEWVRQLPSGLETQVGETGCRLSGGQRQKIAIARALLQQPDFLILDEPTNHLDLRAVAKILETLRSLPQMPGILLVTHDEALAGQADERITL